MWNLENKQMNKHIKKQKQGYRENKQVAAQQEGLWEEERNR